MRRRLYATMMLFAGAGLACSGGNEDDGDSPPIEDRDGGVQAPRDGGPIVEPNDDFAISGTAYRLDAYLEGAKVPLAGASIRALGVVGVSPVGSEADGTYRVEVPQNGAVILEIGRASCRERV